jgi:hypothetical protein
MNMIHVSNCRLKKFLMILLSIGFILAFSVPAMAAGPLLSSSGSALIKWDPAPTFQCVTANDKLAKIIWSEKNSFSGSWSGLNRKETDPGDSDFFEGVPPDAPAEWVATSFVAGLLDSFGSVTGYADTKAGFPSDPNDVPNYLNARVTRGFPDEIFATSQVGLKLLGEGDVFIAQAVLQGLFTVSEDCDLTVSGPGYELQQTLRSTLGRSAYSDVTVSLALYDFNATDPSTGNSPLLTESTVPLVNNQKSLFTRTNTYFPQGGKSGTLPPLKWALKAPTSVDPVTGEPLTPDNVYDFEASASTVAAAGLPLFRGFPFWWWHRFLVK